MQKLQAAALQGNAAFYAASVFAVSGQRMLPGCKLHPDLMGAAGVQRDLSKAHLSCRFHDAVFQHGFPYTSARAAHREYPAPAAVLEQPVPQGAFGGQCFVRPACNDGPIPLDELRHFRLPFGPAILHSVGVLTLGDLTAECGLTADNYISLGQFFPTVGYDTEVIYTWVATGLHKTQMHLDADEFLTPDRVPLDKAYEMVMSGEIRDGKTIAGILKLKALIAEGRL